MANRKGRRALRGVEEETFDLISNVCTGEQWALLLKAPLNRAAALGNRGLARKLVQAGADIGNALHAAAWGGHRDIVNDFLLNGESVGVKDTNGCTPLHVAARRGKAEIVRLLLLNGADINALDNQEWTPLLRAVYHGHATVALALLAGGADVSLRCGAVKGSAVHMAAEMGRLGILRAMIEHGADVNAGDTNHCTALHVAASENKVEAINVLVEAGGNIEVRSIHGMEPIHSAAGQLNIEALLALLKHGADVNAKSLNLLSPLMVAATKAGAQGAAEVVNLLLRSGADEAIADEDGHIAGDMVGRAVKEKYRLAGDVKRVRELLTRAPADRAWRRRGYLVLCRAYPDRVKPRQKGGSPNNDGTARLRSRSKLRRAEVGSCSTTAGGSTAVDESPGGGWDCVAVRVLGLQEDEIFQTIVRYL